jgi:integrase
MAKRRFGRVRQLPSGRYQARYRGPDGVDRPAPETFATKGEAETWLVKTEADILDDDWLNPDDGKVAFGEYARDWIDQRPELRPKTVELYRYLLRRHLNPAFESKPIGGIKEPQIRRWRKQLLDGGVSEVTAAKAYRLLKAIFATAVDDGAVKRNPCRIKGAGQEHSPERPVLTIAQVYEVAHAVGQRYQGLVLLAMFSSLRWGELAGLRRCDIDLEARTVRVTRQLTEIRGGGQQFGPPKSKAGRRTVPIPELIIPVIQWHLNCFAQDGDDSLVFTSPSGIPLQHSRFRQRIWVPALNAAGLTGVHFHDLRHTGNTLAASAGASLRELMDRMGHDSERAALIYLHGSDARQQAIADTLDKIARAELKRTNRSGTTRPTSQRSGTQRARKGPEAS